VQWSMCCSPSGSVSAFFSWRGGWWGSCNFCGRCRSQMIVADWLKEKGKASGSIRRARRKGSDCARPHCGLSKVVSSSNFLPKTPSKPSIKKPDPHASAGGRRSSCKACWLACAAPAAASCGGRGSLIAPPATGQRVLLPQPRQEIAAIPDQCRETPSFVDRLRSEASVTIFSIALPFRRSTASRAAMHPATGLTGDRWRLAGRPAPCLR
jgi:hypothetical protein